MRNRSLILLVAIVVASACEKAPPETEPPMRPVRYLAVTDSDGARSRTFSGTSRSTQVSRLSFKVSGTVVELPVEVGDRLRAGMLLARLDRSGFDLEVQQAQANLVQAEANLRNAESNYERVQGLYENNSTSRNDLDAARAGAESARAAGPRGTESTRAGRTEPFLHPTHSRTGLFGRVGQRRSERKRLGRQRGRARELWKRTGDRARHSRQPDQRDQRPHAGRYPLQRDSGLAIRRRGDRDRRLGQRFLTDVSGNGSCRRLRAPAAARTRGKRVVPVRARWRLSRLPRSGSRRREQRHRCLRVRCRADGGIRASP